MRHRRNEFIEGMGGRWLHSREDIGKAFVANYTNLYSFSNPSIPNSLDNFVSQVISPEENDCICSIPNDEEIWGAVKQLGARKAPRPNGLTTLVCNVYGLTVSSN